MLCLLQKWVLEHQAASQKRSVNMLLLLGNRTFPPIMTLLKISKIQLLQKIYICFEELCMMKGFFLKISELVIGDSIKLVSKSVKCI